jgi:hypothetical protein
VKKIARKILYDVCSERITFLFKVYIDSPRGFALAFQVYKKTDE